MIPFLDIHLVLPMFQWLEDSNISSSSSRLALLKHTNMVSYAADEYKRVYGTEAPAGVCRYVVLG